MSEKKSKKASTTASSGAAAPAPAPAAAPSEKILTVEEALETGPKLDHSEFFERLWAGMLTLREKLDANFELKIHPSCADFRQYSATDGSIGSLNTYTGPEIDWLVHSHLSNPTKGFVNIHLNVWLGPHVRMPHFTTVFGTFPKFFCYIDFPPRVDLNLDLPYLDKYYDEQNARFLEVNNNPQCERFISKTVYMRQAISPVGICYLADPTEENFAYGLKKAHESLDLWLKFYKNDPSPVPRPLQSALAERDRFFRMSVAERDPANALAEKLLGTELCNRLVAALWGTEYKNAIVDEAHRMTSQGVVAASSSSSAPVAAPAGNTLAPAVVLSGAAVAIALILRGWKA
eukprot:TRINITY_DN3789_c0_g1_i1.p1 TRINITY_DN3789_c0_g1~~TRINITY_DN3789_c0_g1_i1.p1  ORF type:complete len:346 (-),score=79.92 TRINITY_DN3789_c0_g1_i1:17-1054(-)